MNGVNGGGDGPMEGVRSLLSDPNGVVMAETVFRCYVCHLISDSTEEAYEHFQVNHANALKKEGQLQLGGGSGGGSQNQNNSASGSSSSRGGGGTSAKGGRGGRAGGGPGSRGGAGAGGRRKQSNNTTTQSQQKGATAPGPRDSIGGESDLDETVNQSLNNLEYVPVPDQEMSDIKPTGEDPPTPAAPAKERKSSTSYPPPTPGTMTDIECDVCGAHKSYSYYQRRYGAESCVPCSKFFKMFLYDPKEYGCLSGTHDCPLNTEGDSQVCKACRLTACLATYVTNIDRYPAVVDFLNKTGRSADLDRMRDAWKEHLAEMAAEGKANKAPKTPIPPGTPASGGGRKRAAGDSGGSAVLVTKRASKGSLSMPTTPAGGLKIKPNVNLIKSMPKITFKIKAGSGLLPNLNKASLSALTNQLTCKSFKKSPSSSPAKSPVKVPPALKTKENASLVGHLSRGPNCGSCENCIRNDCGVCFHCKDKRKFGGANKIKKKCLKRICVNNLKAAGVEGSGSGSTHGTRGATRGLAEAAAAALADDDQSDLTNTNEQLTSSGGLGGAELQVGPMDVGVEEDFEDEDLDNYDHVNQSQDQVDEDQIIEEEIETAEEIEEHQVAEALTHLNGSIPIPQQIPLSAE